MRLNQHISNSLKTITFLGFVLAICGNSFAGLIVIDIETSFGTVDSISAPSDDEPTPPGQPVIEDNQDTSFDLTSVSSVSAGAVSALIQNEETLNVYDDPLVGWIRESNRCRSKTSPFDLLRPPQA